MFFKNFPVSAYHPIPKIPTHFQVYVTAVLHFQVANLYQFPAATVTNHHKLRGLYNRNLFFHNTQGQEIQNRQHWATVEAQTGPCPLWRCQKRIHLPLPASGGCWHSLARGCITPISAFMVTLTYFLLCIKSPPASLLQGHMKLYQDPPR